MYGYGGKHVVIVEASSPRSTSSLLKTGQTTSYRTGDDGDLEAGRATDFLTLDSAPLHNNGTATINTTTNRFTDELGGQTYTNDIVLDWSTWDGSKVLGYSKIFTHTGNVFWDVAVDFCLSYSVGGFSGWRLWNYNEMNNVIHLGVTNNFGFAPWNNVGAFQYWTSTTAPNSTTTAYILSASGVGVTGAALKAGASGRAFPVRTFSLSTSNVLS